MERRQGVSVVSLHDVLLKRCDDVSVGRKRSPIGTSPGRLKQVSNETPNEVSLVRLEKRKQKKKKKKHLKKVLDMLQVANKETQSLLLIFNRFHILF